jgi:vitamin B12 transporter
LLSGEKRECKRRVAFIFVLFSGSSHKKFFKNEEKIFVVAAVIISSQLFGQDTMSKVMDEVVITANKFPQKQSGTGKVITVITREQIMRSGGQDLSQLLNEQTGITVNGANSNPGKDKSLFLRGATDKYTLILLDGVPLNDPSGVGEALICGCFHSIMLSELKF